MSAKQASRPKSAHSTMYCVVPHDLAAELHDYLRKHWRDEPAIEVVVEMRASDRRRAERRRERRRVAEDRRRVKGSQGRRIADRRASIVSAEPPAELPRRARRFAERLRFVERVELGARRTEDIESNRLVARLQAGDESAFNLLYLRYFDRVYGYARVALRDSHEAEDVAQQVFMRVISAIPRYQARPGVPFRAWLFRIARNAVIDALPKRQRTQPEDPAKLDLRREASAKEEVEAALGWLTDADVYLFVERLPVAQRQVLVLRYMLDLTTDEIAEVLDRTTKSVRQLQSRALRTLEDRLTTIGRQPRGVRRSPMMVRLKPAPVLAARRFALGREGLPAARHHGRGITRAA